jgi:hypothetical protein
MLRRRTLDGAVELGGEGEASLGDGDGRVLRALSASAV